MQWKYKPVIKRISKAKTSVGSVTVTESYHQELVIQCYSKCHVTSNKAKSNLECAEDKFQTRGWVRGSVKLEERVLRTSTHHKLCAGFD
jgi:hypothetical protein